METCGILAEPALVYSPSWDVKDQSLTLQVLHNEEREKIKTVLAGTVSCTSSPHLLSSSFSPQLKPFLCSFPKAVMKTVIEPILKLSSFHQTQRFIQSQISFGKCSSHLINDKPFGENVDSK